ncbi:MAG: arylsulfatase [Planctomycetia bacterium]|nr:arylsulfatase [Planctomycetia bacterium]
MAAPPNVLLVVTDDQGYGDLACHGNPIVKTPTLDLLHAQSLRLTQFHVDPTCSPTRSALMTGRYSCRTGVWHTIMGRSILRKDEVTMAQVFADAGYRTGIFGKWHLGDNFPFRPSERGFHESLVLAGGGVGQTPDFWGNDYFDDTFRRNNRPEPQQGFCTEAFFRAATKFIEENRERPFFCYLPTNVPHAPYRSPEMFSRPYRDAGLPEDLANFYGGITHFDEQFAELLARLEEWKLVDNTIVIYMTDNGSAQAAFAAGMRGKKGTVYEGGHRVPFFIRWPGKIAAGREVGVLTAHFDVLPTLIELCGLKSPSGVKFDGRSLVPLLLGEKIAWRDRTLFVQSHRIEHPQPWRNSAVLTERWRLVNGKELFDVAADPEQKRDVAASNAEVVADLRRQYEAWYADVSARFDEYCGITLGDERADPVRLCCHDWHGEIAPSDQQALVRKVVANGFWAVDVARPGRYEFTLWQLPDGSAIEATEAKLKIGELEKSAPVPSGATNVKFEAELSKGPARVETFLSGTDGKTRGAYYVDVKYVGPTK